MDLQVTGTITKILPKQEGVSARSGNAWCKQDYVLTEEGGNPQYPSSVCFQVFGADKIAEMAFQYGERVTVHLDITTNEWKDKVFNQINCWKVDRAYGQQPQAPQPAVTQPVPQAGNQGDPQPATTPQQEQSDDLPF